MFVIKLHPFYAQGIKNSSSQANSQRADHTLSLGLEVGYRRISVLRDRLSFGSQYDPNYTGGYNPDLLPSDFSAPMAKNMFDANIGAQYTGRYSDNISLQAGLSLSHLFRPVTSFFEKNDGSQERVPLKYVEDGHAKPNLTPVQKCQIYHNLRNCKILDPACGSGAFPMGILSRILIIFNHILPKDLKTKEWRHDLKTYFVKNCIYGIDIQSIAIHVAKFRFFISLICEQDKKDKAEENYGITSLPNLEAKFVAANTLFGKEEKSADLFTDPKIENLKKELLAIRHWQFFAGTMGHKNRLCEKDRESLEHLAKMVENNDSYSHEDARQLVNWDPYDQNSSADFFDAEWMLGVNEGFDIVIGNPPDVSSKNIPSRDKKKLKKEYGFIDGSYKYFMLKGIHLLKTKGILSYTSSKTVNTPQSKDSLQKLLCSKTILCIFNRKNPFTETDASSKNKTKKE